MATKSMKFWLVKGNPQINNLRCMLTPGVPSTWYDPSDQKKNGAQPGDGIFFWSSGRDRFLLGLGEMGNPLLQMKGRKYIFGLTYLTKAFLKPVTLTELKQEPLFDPNRPSRPYFMIPGPVQTRYPLVHNQAKRLAELILAKNPQDGTAREVLEGWFPELQPSIDSPAMEEQEPDASEFSEGTKAYATHVRYERNRELVEQAKQRHRHANQGKLPCTICGFNFEKNYGTVGKDFAEVHHTIALSEYEKLQKKTTSVEDLIVVCSNCHRMMHRRRPWLTTQEIEKLIE